MAGTVLYIDDEPELPRGTAEELSRLGFRLKHTPDPEEGLGWAREGLSRMVLLEVLLEDEAHDGWQLLEQLGSCTGAAGPLQVLILTRGERTPELYSRAVEAGAADFLTKPVLRAELLAAILECAERSESGRELGAECGGPAGDVAAAFSGDLEEVPLAELLLRLRRVGANGVLLLQFEGESRGIQLRNGSPISAASNRGIETLEDYLVRVKLISGEEHEVVTGAAASRGLRTSEVLVDLGLLDEKGLQDALAQRAGEPLLEGFEWAGGSFRFEAGKQLKSKQTLEFPQSPGQLLLEGCRRWLPSRRVRQLLDRRAAHYVSKEDRPLYGLRDLGPSAPAPDLLTALQGDRTVAEVLESGEVEERVLYGLLVAGLVEVHPDPILELGAELEPVVEEPETPRPPLASSAPDPVMSSVSVEPPSGEPASAAPVDPPKGEVGDDAVSRRVGAERWFQEGNEALAARRYDKAVEVHPDPILELGAELEPVVEEPETPRPPRASSAPDPVMSPVFVEPPSGEPASAAPVDPPKGEVGDDAASRRVAAERWFQEGNEALAARRYDKAVESFGMASHLDPSQGEYHAHLGYALHLQQPRNPIVSREALEHIAKGVKLAPDAWRPLVYLGRVFRLTNDLISARKVIRRTLRLHADCSAARSEMRLIQAAEVHPSTGVVDRVRGWFGRSR